MIVALDGPAGVGKSTIASAIADKAGFFYLNSGNFYRAVTLSALNAGINPEDEKAITENAGGIDISIIDGRIHLNNEDVDAKLHNDRVDAWVAQHSAIIEVREIVTAALRKTALSLDVVAEGRDITTVVFPHADYKFYMDARVEIRAERRFKQGTSSQTLEELIDSIKKRDEIDKSKPVGSLKIADDAIYLDTSDLTIDEVCEKVLDKIQE
ncbi:MAG: (d)CMP kinase [Spirochaetales bacterium]|uniref:Cytidylate kinase n=1 Tax=Candidatus Thalassospirochaeta sargassi TaxID=3119039 RepID=A0AAJ1MI33_9SPIO|nr:(d)CMP kinase [Spirochaetales bacterium]